MNKSAQLVLAFAAALASVVALAAPAGAVTQRPRVVLSSLESTTLSSINTIRSQHGLRPLRLSAGLSAAARQHSREMGARGYFAHESANGASFDRRIAGYYPFASRYHHWSVGENLVWAAPDLDATTALSLWMHSPEHRRNILTPGWQEMGISAVHVAGAPGVDGGD